MKYYVRLVRGKGFVSRLVEFKESDWPSHVELVKCDDYDTPLVVLSSRYPGGVRIRGYNDYSVLTDIWYESTLTPSNSVERAWEEIYKLLGNKYDLIDILGIGFYKDWHVDGRFICSEAVAYGFESAGIPLFGKTEIIRKIMPSHFLLTPYLKRYKVVKHK